MGGPKPFVTIVDMVKNRSAELNPNHRRDLLSHRIVDAISSGRLDPHEAQLEYDVHRMKVRQVLREHGIPIPQNQCGTKRRPHPQQKATCFQILALLLSTNDPCTIIAKKFGISKTRVLWVLDQARLAGIEFPNRPRKVPLKKSGA